MSIANRLLTALPWLYLGAGLVYTVVRNASGQLPAEGVDGGAWADVVVVTDIAVVVITAGLLGLVVHGRGLGVRDRGRPHQRQLDDVPVPTFLVSTGGERLVAANAAARDRYGIPVGMDDRYLFEDLFEQAAVRSYVSTPGTSVDCRTARLDGRLVGVVRKPIDGLSAEDAVDLVIAIDLDDRHTNMADSPRRGVVQRLADQTDDLLFIVNVSGVIRAANAAFRRRLVHVLGIDLPILTPLPPSATVLVEWRMWQQNRRRAEYGEQFVEDRTDVDEAGRQRMFEHRFDPVIEHGVVAAVACSVREVTRDRKDAIMLRDTSVRLRTITEQYEALVRATNDVVWVWSSDTRMIEWNDAMGSAFGYQERETSLSWLYDRIDEEDRDRVVSARERCVADGGQTWEEEFRFRHHDGRYHWVVDRGLVLRDDFGAVRRLMGTMMDVDDARSAMARISRQNEQLRDIARIGSHEIRGPLASLMGLLYLMDKEHPENPLNGEVVTMLDEAAQRLDAVIHRIVQATYELDILDDAIHDDGIRKGTYGPSPNDGDR